MLIRTNATRDWHASYSRPISRYSISPTGGHKKIAMNIHQMPTCWYMTSTMIQASATSELQCEVDLLVRDYAYLPQQARRLRFLYQ